MLNLFWCELCNKPAVRCTECDNISCSGGGCNKCYDLFEHVAKLIKSGNIPPKEKLPLYRSFDWDNL